MTHQAIAQALTRVGFTDFRSPEQEKLISAICGGEDALGILPTGSGKSACFIIPTLAKGWKTMVISPLIALMNDQVSKLRAQGITAYALSSEADKFEVLEATLTMLGTPGKSAFLYVSPEMALSDCFRKRFAHFKPNLLVIDEAHCVSTWGDNFRPTYLRIREIATRFGSPQCVALSATIDKKIEADVCTLLPLRKGFLKVSVSPMRANLRIVVETPGSKAGKVEERNRQARQRLFQILAKESEGAIIVYCYSRNTVAREYEHVSDMARRLGYTPTLFHATLTPDDKRRALQKFIHEPRPLVFCTTAFGMGIDRPDVRRVIHFDPPSTLVDYAQQIGRGGRDGLPAVCTTFFDPRRIDRLDTQVHATIPDIKFVERIYQRLVNAQGKADDPGQFSLVGFQRQLELMADKDANYPELYKQRAQRSIGLLRRAGYITEGEKGMVIKVLGRGSSRHLALIEGCEMANRRQSRETERLKRFFSSEPATQELLWQIVGE